MSKNTSIKFWCVIVFQSAQLPGVTCLTLLANHATTLGLHTVSFLSSTLFTPHFILCITSSRITIGTLYTTSLPVPLPTLSHRPHSIVNRHDNPRNDGDSNFFEQQQPSLFDCLLREFLEAC